MKENILQNIEFQGNKQLWINEEIYHEIALFCEDIKWYSFVRWHLYRENILVKQQIVNNRIMHVVGLSKSLSAASTWIV